MISQVFYTRSGKWAFQSVGGAFLVYNDQGDPVGEFRSFYEVCDFLAKYDH